MTITNGYCTLPEIKHTAVLNLSASDYDTMLEAVIESVSRTIDNVCGRFFYSASETRFFTAGHPDRLFITDLNSTASVTIYTDDDGDGTYENTWAATDFILMPENAALNNWPATYIDRAINGNYSFPAGVPKGVKITASFGWAAVPKAVNRACLLQSVRLYKRYVTPLGISAAAPVGQQQVENYGLDPDVEMLIKPYMILI